MATLFPFKFVGISRLLDVQQHFSGLEFATYSRCCEYLAVIEPLANVVLFMPFGFGLAALLFSEKATAIKLLGIVLLLSAGFSFLVELLQVLQPWRSPTITDVVMNTIGGGAGLLGYMICRKIMSRREKKWTWL